MGNTSCQQRREDKSRCKCFEQVDVWECCQKQYACKRVQRSPASQSQSTIEDRRAQRERSLVIQPDIETPGSK